MSAEGIWVYAVIRAEQADDRVTGLHGVAGEPIRVVAADDLAAVVGAVELDEFGHDALHRNLEDLDWVANTARAHDAVITAVARFGPVIPVRMATVYLDDGRVRKLLENRREDFAATLCRLSGRDELGVKVFAAQKALLAQDGQDDHGPQTGTAYLMRRRRELVSREEAYQLAAAEADRIHSTLMRHAVDGKRRPPPDRSLTGKDEVTVLNGTYLVDSDAVELFRETVAALSMSTGRLSLEMTGPWPPYSFAGEPVAQ